MPLTTCSRTAQTLAGNPRRSVTGNAHHRQDPGLPAGGVSCSTRLRRRVVMEGRGADIKALCRDADGKLLGYALTGEAVREKLALNKELPALLA